MSNMKPAQGRKGAALSRRALVASAASCALSVAVDPAQAQRCPAEPPERAKGPPVFRGFDQTDIDEGYDNDIWAFNVKNIDARRAANNEIALSAIGKPQRAAYGPTEIEGLDIYKTRRANAPTLIFIHGGTWRNGKAAQFTVYAEPFVKAGANFVVPDFANVGQTGGDLFPMVDQCRRVVAWVKANAATYGGDPNRLYLCSRSSGSHLASCVLITDWEKQGLPLDILKGAVLGSGMYDLEPVSMSKRQAFVKFTPAAIAELSAIRHIDRIHTPVFIGNGGSETPEFLRQAAEFAAALRAAGKPVQQVVAKGYNHYEMGETIGNPYALLGRAAMDMMGLNTF